MEAILPEVQEPSLQALTNRFIHLRDEAVEGSGIDVGVSAHARAVVQMLEVPEFREDMAALLQKRPNLPIDNTATQIFHATHKLVVFDNLNYDQLRSITDRDERRVALLDTLAHVHDEEYFSNVFNQDFWLEKLEQTYKEKGGNYQRFDYDLFFRVNQTNVAERNVSSFLAGILMQRILSLTTGEREVSKLDVGCSANLGLVQEDLGIPFSPIEFKTLTADGSSIEVDDDVVTTSAINRLLQIRQRLGLSFGIDITDVDQDLNDMLWVVTNSFKPEELLPGQPRKARFMELWGRKPESAVKTEVADYGDLEFNAQLPSLNRKYNMINFYTVLNQHEAAKRRVMLERAKKMLADAGVILVQDFATVHPSNPHEPVFLEKWDAWQYRTLMYDKVHGFQEIFRWLNGRCEVGALGSGEITLGDHRLKPADLLAV